MGECDAEMGKGREQDKGWGGGKMGGNADTDRDGYKVGMGKRLGQK